MSEMPTALAHDGVAIEVNGHGSGPSILMHPLPEHAGLYLEFKKLNRELDQTLIETMTDRYRLVMFEYPGDAKTKTLTPANVVRTS